MVRLTDRPDITLDVNRRRKTSTQQQQQQPIKCLAKTGIVALWFDTLRGQMSMLQEIFGKFSNNLLLWGIQF